VAAGANDQIARARAETYAQKVIEQADEHHGGPGTRFWTFPYQDDVDRAGARPLIGDPRSVDAEMQATGFRIRYQTTLSTNERRTVWRIEAGIASAKSGLRRTAAMNDRVAHRARTVSSYHSTL
jgi:hypothetical protein